MLGATGTRTHTQLKRGPEMTDQYGTAPSSVSTPPGVRAIPVAAASLEPVPAVDRADFPLRAGNCSGISERSLVCKCPRTLLHFRLKLPICYIQTLLLPPLGREI
jgi:hypothetical protein